MSGHFDFANNGDAAGQGVGGDVADDLCLEIRGVDLICREAISLDEYAADALDQFAHASGLDVLGAELFIDDFVNHARKFLGLGRISCFGLAFINLAYVTTVG